MDYVLGARTVTVPQGPVSQLVDWYELHWSAIDSSASLVVSRRRSGNFHIREVGGQAASQLPVINASKAEFLARAARGLEDLPETPFGPVSSRDLLLLNHRAQYDLGDPFSFVSASAKSMSRLKIGYLLQAFGFVASGTTLPKRHEKRYIERQRPFKRAAEDYFIPELIRLARLASDIGVLSVPADILLTQHEHVIFDELSQAMERLTLGQAQKSGLMLKLSDDAARAGYRLGVLAGRIAEVLKLYGEVIEDRRASGAKTNAEFGRFAALLDSAETSLLPNAFSAHMERSIDLMGLDRVTGQVTLDPGSMSVVIAQEGGRRLPLTEVGGQQNYVGYNIAALVSLHLALAELDAPIAGSFLVIDQPSQAFYETHAESEHPVLTSESSDRLQRLYGALDVIARDEAKCPLLIVLERAPPENIAAYSHSTSIEDWSGYLDGLLPKSWLAKEDIG